MGATNARLYDDMGYRDGDKLGCGRSWERAIIVAKRSEAMKVANYMKEAQVLLVFKPSHVWWHSEDVTGALSNMVAERG